MYYFKNLTANSGVWTVSRMAYAASLCLISSVAQSQTPAPSPVVPHSNFVPKGMKLTFNDEFNGSELDLQKWNYRQLGERDGALNAKETVKLDGKGNLLMTADFVDGRVRCSMISTEKTFLQKYGYFESRIKFQRQQGLHGAFWLQSPTYGQVKDDLTISGAEIDIVEFFGVGKANNTTGSIHWNSYGKDEKTVSGKAEAVVNRVKHAGLTTPTNTPDMCDAFHIYAVEWNEKGYRFLLDGIEFFKTNQAISKRDQCVILSLLSSSWERKMLNTAKLPDVMTVDYVRVYE